MTEQNKKYKALVFMLPASGHVNPMIGIARELKVKRNMDVIFYGTPDLKKRIELSGVEYRNFPHWAAGLLNAANNGLRSAGTLMEVQASVSYHSVSELANVIESEKADVICLDQMCMPAKYAIEYVERRIREGKSSLATLPPQINILTTFHAPHMIPKMPLSFLIYDLLVYLWIVFKLLFK